VITSEGLIVAFARRFGETFVRLTEFMKETGDEFEGRFPDEDIYRFNQRRASVAEFFFLVARPLISSLIIEKSVWNCFVSSLIFRRSFFDWKEREKFKVRRDRLTLMFPETSLFIGEKIGLLNLPTREKYVFSHL
jgi:hypothetical protein